MGLRQYVQFDDPKDALPRYLKTQRKILGGGFVMVITGGKKKKMRTGKSWTAARIGEVLVPDFKVDNIVAKPMEFLEQQAEIEKKAKGLDVLIMDEGGVALSNKQWQGMFNRLVSFSVQIAGDMNCIIIIIAPNFSLIDKSVRMLVAYWGYCVKRRDEKGKTQVYLHLYETNTDLLTGNVYFSRLRFYDRVNKKVVIAKSFRVNKINDDLAKAYVEKSTKFKSDLREEFLEEARRFQQKGQLDEKLNYTEFAGKALEHEYVQETIARDGRLSEVALLKAFPELNNAQLKFATKMINHIAGRKK